MFNFNNIMIIFCLVLEDNPENHFSIDIDLLVKPLLRERNFSQKPPLKRTRIKEEGGTATIKKLLWHLTEDFRKKTLMLLLKDAINVEILKDINYNILSPHASDVLWTLLYYGGYLTMNEDENLCILNMMVFTEWKGWLNNRILSNLDNARDAFAMQFHEI
ncbi:hypothetical protein C1645_851995 [Glomus cerebriforme]|uniref:Uncharacterized protein n=1 Tax=Glomus cerebriforme TaxID=658196 RepID=A0A397SY97_9GLOM|nr:hypothetical protein C1645_851995 [Glomus cerebriforme]